MTQYYKVLPDLPKIPEDMLHKLLEIAEDDAKFLADAKRTSDFWPQDKQITGQIRSNPKIRLDQSFWDWCTANIASGFTECSVKKTVWEGDHFWPHTDRTRNYALLYLLAAGGPDHKTVFYKTAADEIPEPGTVWPEYEGLIEVDSIQIPLYTWTLLDARYPHSIENIPNGRISFQLGFNAIPSELAEFV